MRTESSRAGAAAKSTGSGPVQQSNRYNGSTTGGNAKVLFGNVYSNGYNDPPTLVPASPPPCPTDDRSTIPSDVRSARNRFLDQVCPPKPSASSAGNGQMRAP